MTIRYLGATGRFEPAICCFAERALRANATEYYEYFRKQRRADFGRKKSSPILRASWSYRTIRLGDLLLCRASLASERHGAQRSITNTFVTGVEPTSAVKKARLYCEPLGATGRFDSAICCFAERALRANATERSEVLRILS